MLFLRFDQHSNISVISQYDMILGCMEAKLLILLFTYLFIFGHSKKWFSGLVGTAQNQ